MVDKEKIKKGVELILDGIGQDKESDGLKNTPKRIANFYEEWLEYDENVKHTLFEEKYEDMVIIKDIPFFSLCEHHMLPFFGTMKIGYIPNKKIVGLSKIVKVAHKFARRLQTQERIGKQIAEELEGALNPLGIMVVIEAEHLCMSMRGVRTPGSKTVTSEVRGAFRKEQKVREEFLMLIK
jgi:GTP cyclohydrolase I